MSDIQPYHPPEALRRFVVPDIDSWIAVVADVAQFASKIADTEFVPDSLRGKPAAVTAAILSGREMGVPPMTSVQNIYIVKNKPGQTAQLMRQLVLAAGHIIKTVEATDTRCILKGRRRGDAEDTWESVTFTADQAKKAGINLGGYPEDKLFARATTRLCRRKFADVIGGMPYSAEELQDGVELIEPREEAATAVEAEKPKRRTAQRRNAVRQPQTQSITQAPEPAPASAGPALPGEAGYDELGATQPRPQPETPLDEETPAGEESVTQPQLTKLHAVMTSIGLSDRKDKLGVASKIVRRKLTSSFDLSKNEAKGLIDTLEICSQHDDPMGYLTELLDAFDERGDAVNTETGELPPQSEKRKES